MELKVDSLCYIVLAYIHIIFRYVQLKDEMVHQIKYLLLADDGPTNLVMRHKIILYVFNHFSVFQLNLVIYNGEPHQRDNFSSQQ